MKLNRTLVMCLTIALCASIAIGGSMAYLTSTAGNRNVMTVGNVEIEQHEYQREILEDGSFGTELVPFDDAKKMIPAYYEELAYDGTITINEKEYTIFNKSVEGEVDKIVTVYNKDTSEPVYVRTIVAFEHTDPNGDEDFSDGIAWDLHHRYNGVDWDYKDYAGTVLDNILIDNNYWSISTFTYKKELAPGATTEPSMMQVFLDKTVTSDELKLVNGEYEILVLSQAVQAQMGDLTPAEALDTAFGEINEANVREWMSQLIENALGGSDEGTPDVEEGTEG